MRGPHSDGALAPLRALLPLVRSLPRYSPALGVVGVLVCMLVPLPTAWVDLLLSLSLALGALLLVVCLGLRRSADFLAFPSLLLLVTLLRLSLNVQTTRLILADADAGRVIDAFAALVVRGDMIVGAVIFAIITAVQYLVIARGSERVAEVAARFALDGLPGHQGAIDADLRGGAISAHEAANRRAALLERSSFYGAMDGAIRFVKGDAVAGLVITAINLVGGVAVGIVRHGLSAGESFSVYGRLTIGDGLVAQIPALLVSLAAGVLVVRVDRRDEARPLAWLEPAALLFPAALLAALSAVEGMPRAAFGASALGLLMGGMWLALRRPQTRAEAPVIRVLLPRGEDPRGLRRPLIELRRRCERALGVPLPEVVAEASALLGAGALEMRLEERVLAARDEGIRGEEAVVVEVFRVLMAHAPIFVDLHAIEGAVEALRQEQPALVREALKSRSLADVLGLCRGLLRERIPMPPLAALLEAISSDRRFSGESERPRWLGLCRERLASYWVRDLLTGQGRLGPLQWVRPTPEVEEELMARSIAGELAEGPGLSLSAAERARWRAAIKASAGEGSYVLLTTAAARGAFAALLRGAAPFVPVISAAELAAAGIGEPAADEVRWFLGGCA